MSFEVTILRRVVLVLLSRQSRASIQSFKESALNLSTDTFILSLDYSSVPIPTYFTIGIQPLPSSIASLIKEKAFTASIESESPLELLPNLFFLGKSGVKMVKGLRIAVAGGGWNTSKWAESASNISRVESDQVSEKIRDEGCLSPLSLRSRVNFLLAFTDEVPHLLNLLHSLTSIPSSI